MLKPNICQDGLGTNMGKLQKIRFCRAARSPKARAGRTGGQDLGRTRAGCVRELFFMSGVNFEALYLSLHLIPGVVFNLLVVQGTRSARKSSRRISSRVWSEQVSRTWRTLSTLATWRNQMGCPRRCEDAWTTSSQAIASEEDGHLVIVACNSQYLDIVVL